MLPVRAASTSGYEDLMTYVEHMNGLTHGTACALYVIQGGHTAAEFYAGKHTLEPSARRTAADSQFNVASVRKSYLGFAAAWALHHGKIGSLDDPVLRYMSVSPEQRASLEGVTLRHLLTHTHGLVKAADRSISASFSPGSSWAYNNVGVNLLSGLLPQAMGRTIAEVLHDHVFEPLGWHETEWRTSPAEQLVPVMDAQGQSSLFVGSSSDGSEGNLFVSARELAYWGYLHLKLGRVNGKTAVPEAVIRTAVSAQTPASLPRSHPQNGCFWFVKQGESVMCPMGAKVPIGSIEIVGFYGPIVFIVPELDLVVVRMANTNGNYSDERGTYNDYLKAFSEKAVEAAWEAANTRM